MTSKELENSNICAYYKTYYNRETKKRYLLINDYRYKCKNPDATPEQMDAMGNRLVDVIQYIGEHPNKNKFPSVRSVSKGSGRYYRDGRENGLYEITDAGELVKIM